MKGGSRKRRHGFRGRSMSPPPTGGGAMSPPTGGGAMSPPTGGAMSPPPPVGGGAPMSPSSPSSQEIVRNPDLGVADNMRRAYYIQSIDSGVPPLERTGPDIPYIHFLTPDYAWGTETYASDISKVYMMHAYDIPKDVLLSGEELQRTLQVYYDSLTSEGRRAFLKAWRLGDKDFIYRLSDSSETDRTQMRLFAEYLQVDKGSRIIGIECEGGEQAYGARGGEVIILTDNHGIIQLEQSYQINQIKQIGSSVGYLKIT